MTTVIPILSQASGIPTATALYDKPSAAYAQREHDALAVLRAAAAAHPGRIVQATSLGVEDMVLTDLIARHGLPIAVATLDTGALHDVTLDLIGRTERHYGLRVGVWRPDAAAVERFVAANGAGAMYRSVELRQGCCGVRKLEPLARMLHGRDAWIAGLRREQSANRSSVEPQERDPQGRIKYSPLAEWTLGDVWHYVCVHAVPYNPLHDRFFPSIGCAPCTRAVSLGEDFRAGRWWWERDGAAECGLHADRTGAGHGATPGRRATGVGA